MGDESDYDWWAAEGRPEHLRPLHEAGSRMFDDPALREAGIAVFKAGVDDRTGRLRVTAAAGDPKAARDLIERRYTLSVDLEVVAAAEYIETAIEWDWWTLETEAAIDVWVDARVDENGVRATLTETPDDVVVELWGAVYQGGITADYIPSPTHVRLREPLGSRRVIDGATGRAGATKPPL